MAANSRSAETARYQPGAPLRTFHDVVPAFRDGKDNPRAYLERCLETIAAREEGVKAFVVLNAEGARAAADASTKRYRAGQPLSPIDGMPIGIKDLYETHDMPTQMGSPLFKGYQTKRDCASVYALREGGAVMIGKTVTTELGFYNPGPTRNPYDLSRTPGGSSSGSAAAVGAGMVPAAIGSQVVGSLIRPSSYCGNYGFKPSFGALNRGGGGTGLSQAVIGTHGGCLEDAWAVAHQIAAVSGGDPGHPGLFGDERLAQPVKPPRLIMVETAGWRQCSDAIRQKLRDTVARLQRNGVEIVAAADDRRVAEFEAAILDAKDVTHVLCGYELRWPLKLYRERGPDALSATMLKLLAEWEKTTTEEYRAALARRVEMRQKHAALETIAPALMTLAAHDVAPIGMDTGDPIYAVPSSILGAPALSLPLLADEGMPLGLQLIGYPHGDARLFAIAGGVTEALRTVE